MKHIKIIFLLITLLSFSAFANVYVKGYTKSNGTYVQSHYRTSPNKSAKDNWSTKGNINPYSGKEGTKNSYN